MNRDYYYQPHRKFGVAFKAGTTYARVLDAAAAAIERDGAGKVVADGRPDAVDASHCWKIYGGRVKYARG